MKKVLILYVLMVMLIQLPFVLFSYHEDINTGWVFSPEQVVLIDQKQIHKKLKSFVVDREIIVNAEGEPELVMYKNDYFQSSDAVLQWMRFSRINDIIKEKFLIFGNHYKYSLIHIAQYILWGIVGIFGIVAFFNRKKDKPKNEKIEKKERITDQGSKKAVQNHESQENEDNQLFRSPMAKDPQPMNKPDVKKTVKSADEVDLSFFDPKDE